MIPEKFCILDVETWAPSGKPDPEKDELRYVGFKSFTGAYRIFAIDQTKEITSALCNFPYFIGHNILLYDIPILNRYGFKLKGIPIDTYKITDKRCKSMMYIDLNDGEKSLKKLCERFKLKTQKGSFDYNKMKEKLNEEDEKLLIEYLKTDLDCAEDLFLFYYNLFVGFKELVAEKDKRTMSWLTSSPGTVAYKVICNKAGLKEEYDDTQEMKNRLYEGAYVSVPYIDYVE